MTIFQLFNSPYIYFVLIIGGGASMILLGQSVFFYVVAPISNAFSIESQPDLVPRSLISTREYAGNMTVGRTITIDNVDYKFLGSKVAVPDYSNDTESGTLTIHFAIKNRNALPTSMDESKIQVEGYNIKGELTRYYSPAWINDNGHSEPISFDEERQATLVSHVGQSNELEVSYKLTMFSANKRLVFDMPLTNG